jgi:hypothetical protein
MNRRIRRRPARADPRLRNDRSGGGRAAPW